LVILRIVVFSRVRQRFLRLAAAAAQVEHGFDAVEVDFALSARIPAG
jgi:hypothetical protein